MVMPMWTSTSTPTSSTSVETPHWVSALETISCFSQIGRAEWVGELVGGRGSNGGWGWAGWWRRGAGRGDERKGTEGVWMGGVVIWLGGAGLRRVWLELFV